MLPKLGIKMSNAKASSQYFKSCSRAACAAPRRGGGAEALPLPRAFSGTSSCATPTGAARSTSRSSRRVARRRDATRAAARRGARARERAARRSLRRRRPFRARLRARARSRSRDRGSRARAGAALARARALSPPPHGSRCSRATPTTATRSASRPTRCSRRSTRSRCSTRTSRARSTRTSSSSCSSTQAQHLGPEAGAHVPEVRPSELPLSLSSRLPPGFSESEKVFPSSGTTRTRAASSTTTSSSRSGCACATSTRSSTTAASRTARREAARARARSRRAFSLSPFPSPPPPRERGVPLPLADARRARARARATVRLRGAACSLEDALFQVGRGGRVGAVGDELRPLLLSLFQEEENERRAMAEAERWRAWQARSSRRRGSGPPGRTAGPPPPPLCVAGDPQGEGALRQRAQHRAEVELQTSMDAGGQVWRQRRRVGAVGDEAEAPALSPRCTSSARSSVGQFAAPARQARASLSLSLSLSRALGDEAQVPPSPDARARAETSFKGQARLHRLWRRRITAGRSELESGELGQHGRQGRERGRRRGRLGRGDGELTVPHAVGDEAEAPLSFSGSSPFRELEAC